MRARSREAVTSSGSRIRLMGYAPHERQPRHTHHRTTLTLVLRGSLEERVGDCLHRAAVLSLAVKPAGTPHEDCSGPEAFRVDLVGDGWVIVARFDSGATEASAMRMLDVDLVRSR